jgi:hypothetical protein
VEQELPTLLEHLSSPPVFSGINSLIHAVDNNDSKNDVNEKLKSDISFL